MLAKLFFAWLLFRGRANNSAPEPGQGAIVKQQTVKGLDGREYKATTYADGTALVETAAAAFYVHRSAPDKPTKIVRGDAAAVADMVKNLPE